MYCALFSCCTHKATLVRSTKILYKYPDCLLWWKNFFLFLSKNGHVGLRVIFHHKVLPKHHKMLNRLNSFIKNDLADSRSSHNGKRYVITYDVRILKIMTQNYDSKLYILYIYITRLNFKKSLKAFSPSLNLIEKWPKR